MSKITYPLTIRLDLVETEIYRVLDHKGKYYYSTSVKGLINQIQKGTGEVVKSQVNPEGLVRYYYEYEVEENIEDKILEQRNIFLTSNPTFKLTHVHINPKDSNCLWKGVGLSYYGMIIVKDEDVPRGEVMFRIKLKEKEDE